MELHITATILPGRVILTFQKDSLVLDPSQSESYTFLSPAGWHITKLVQLEKLCFDLLSAPHRTHRKKHQHQQQSLFPLANASAQLRDIENLPSRLYSPAALTAIYFVASMSSALLFYWGNGTDSAWAGVFGAVVYGVELLSFRLVGLSEVTSFTSSFFVSLSLARASSACSPRRTAAACGCCPRTSSGPRRGPRATRAQRRRQSRG